MSDEGKKQNEQTKEEKKKIPPIIIGAATKETNQNGQSKVKVRLLSNPIVIAAIITAVGGIIVALITHFKSQPITLEVFLIDLQTKQGISGEVFVDTENNGVRSVPDRPGVIKVRKGDRFIRAESDGYKTELVPIDRVAGTLIIEMEMTAVAVAAQPTPLSFTGGRAWSDEITISEGTSANEIIVNGTTTDAAGFFITGLPSAMRGRTLVLYFSNTRASSFSRSRMVKIEYNADDLLLRPTNASIVDGGYLTAGDTPLDNGIEFPIPDDFNGRLNFTFYLATLNTFRITAYYR
jgi:hypothetical protein